MNTNTYKKEFSGIGFCMLISTAVILLLQYGTQMLALSCFPQWGESMTILLAVTMLPLYIIGFPISFVLMRNREAATIEKHSMKPGQILIAFLISYGLMIIGNIIGLIFTAVIGVIKGSPVQNTLLNVITDSSLWLTAIFTVLCAPVFEEILFRKLVCDKVIKYGEGCTIVLSGLLFGLFHMNFNQFFYAFFLGCFFAFIYVKTGNLKYTIILHMTINFFGSVLGGVILTMDQTNPITLIFSALFSLCVFGMGIAGIILFFVKRRAMTLKPGAVTIEKGQRFKTVILNPGMLLYCLALIGITLVQAFLL